MSAARIVSAEAEVLAVARHAAGQVLMRLAAPEVARRAAPGQFVHVETSPALPLRRPLSILHADPERGTLDLYFRIVGRGTEALAARRTGESLPLLGPIGRGFPLDPARRHLLIGGGVGAPPVIFAARRLAAAGAAAVLFLGFEARPPFALRPSTFLLPGVPEAAMLAMPELEERGVPVRLASQAGIPGAFEGFVTELAERWLAAIPDKMREELVILGCGPEPMLAAAARLARRWGVPCELALEARMACGVGGCAGCVVRVREGGETRYARVCVDGPVFPAERLPDFWNEEE